VPQAAKPKARRVRGPDDRRRGLAMRERLFGHILGWRGGRPSPQRRAPAQPAACVRQDKTRQGTARHQKTSRDKPPQTCILQTVPCLVLSYTRRWLGGRSALGGEPAPQTCPKHAPNMPKGLVASSRRPSDWATDAPCFWFRGRGTAVFRLRLFTNPTLAGIRRRASCYSELRVLGVS
jgi:hypothetical protein